MPSHKELLQARASETEHAHSSANREVERLHRQVAAEREEIEKLSAQYTESCRQLAGGANADPARILAERDRRTHRLNGLETLKAEATTAANRANLEHNAAARELQAELDREELERLWEIVRGAERRKDEAVQALSAATQELNAAVFAKDQFRRGLERQEKARA